MASTSVPRLASIICDSRSVCCCTWLTISSVLPVIDEPKALLAASTERSISAEVDLTLAETSFDVAGQRLDLGRGVARGGHQRRLGVAGAGQDRVRGRGADRGEDAFDFSRG